MNNATHTDSARTAGAQHSSGSSIVLSLLSTAMISLTVTVVALFAYHRATHRPIIAVDVDRIMQDRAQYMRSRIESGIDKPSMLRDSKEWAARLSREIDAVAKRNSNAVVLTRPAVLVGAYDMTDVVLERLDSSNPPKKR